MDIVERLRENADLDAAEHVPADVVQMQYEAAAEILRLRDELNTVRDAVRPFVRLVRDTSGRIPTERLSFADWHAIAKVIPSETAANCDHKNRECTYESDDGEFERWQCKDCGARWVVEIAQ